MPQTIPNGGWVGIGMYLLLGITIQYLLTNLMWTVYASISLLAFLILDHQRMYSLLPRIPEGLEPLWRKFEEHVKRTGLAAVSKLVGTDPTAIETTLSRRHMSMLCWRFTQSHLFLWILHPCLTSARRQPPSIYSRQLQAIAMASPTFLCNRHCLCPCLPSCSQMHPPRPQGRESPCHCERSSQDH
jgi:hypothetical protein